MKRHIAISLLLAFCSLGTWAQSSSMTDNQVMEFVVKEREAGTSNAQIVTKLMQKGVDINQIRRVRDKAERLQKQQGTMGYMNSGTTKDTDSRQRTNNGKTREEYLAEQQAQGQLRQTNTTYQTAAATQQRTETLPYNETNMDWLDMQAEMGSLLPMDTTQMLEQLMEERRALKRKVFGRDIFNNRNLTFEPNMNIATPQNYRLGPGDAVIIDIYGASQKTIESTVSPDGDVTIEGFGPVQVSGLTVAQANARLRATLGSRYSSSKVKLTVGQTKTIMVNVMGEVKVPGTYTLSAFATVFHALYMAGGTNDLGTLRAIKVYRANKLISTVDIYDYILNGKLTGNVRLAEGDVIVVGPYDCLVTIAGKVKRPMIYEMKKNESIGTVLQYAGGFTGDAYTKSMRVLRKTGRERSVVTVDEFDFASFHIADGDSVGVDSILERYSNTVEVKGAVFRPGLYNIGSNISSVRQLIEHAEGLTEEAFTARAVMHRMKTDRSLEVLSVDVKGIMEGRVADVPLRENDVLFIPTRTDVQVKRTITIRGEVNYPGTYEYADNETIEDFVLQAGGLTDKASTVKVNVARRVSNPTALRPDSLIARTYSLALKDGFVIDGTPGFTLMPFDEVSVFKSPATLEQQNVVVEGEVMFAGTYTLTKRNSRLSDLVAAAGGANDMAYVQGARLERKTNEVERQRMQAAYRMAMEQQEKNMLSMAMSSNNGSAISQMADRQKNTQMQKFQVPETYTVGIELDEALSRPGSDADIVLREGDKLVIPQYNGTVKVNGAVMYPNTVAYEKGKSAKFYIDAAGGFSTDARKSNAYIIYMNGMVAKVAHGAKVRPGCEIVVPEKASRKMTVAERMAMGSSMSSIAAMVATIANLSR